MRFCECHEQPIDVRFVRLDDHRGEPI